MLLKAPVPTPLSPVAFEKIGLTAAPDGDALQVQWNRHARAVRDADHAIVYIRDGNYQSQLDLTPQQLNSASIRYWPESKSVAFRMELYTGAAATSDSVEIPVATPLNSQPPQPPKKQGRTLLVKNPSPFERVRPEVVRREPSQPAPVISPVVARAESVPPPPVMEPRHESGFSRVVSKIPLLRRLKKHRPSDSSAFVETEPRR
jgi:hypothetical protein